MRSASYLQYHADYDRWVLQTPSADAGTVTWSIAKAATAPALNTWTHLTGVYDSTARQLRLYVNGTLAGKATGVTTWHANDPFRIGRSFSGGRFAGQLDGVRVDDVALSVTRIVELAS